MRIITAVRSWGQAPIGWSFLTYQNAFVGQNLRRLLGDDTLAGGRHLPVAGDGKVLLDK